MPGIGNESVRPPALLMDHACEVAVIIVERCRRLAREALDPAKCSVLNCDWKRGRKLVRVLSQKDE